MTDRILFVDDEPNILLAYKRSVGTRFDLDTAPGGLAGIEAIEQRGPYAVIVSDLQMPGMNGIEFLAKASEIAPDTVRMMLTGHADQDSAIQAVNEGRIFRFLTKPTPPELLATTLEAGVKQYRLVVAEKELLQGTLRGSIKILSEILSAANMRAFGRAVRVRNVARQIAASLNVDNTWALDIATMLSQVGCVAIPREILTKAYHGKPLSPEEKSIFNTHPETGRLLVQNLPRLASVAEIIGYQEKHFDGTGVPADTVAKEDIPWESRVLKVALDYDALKLSGHSDQQALVEMRKRKGTYDPRLILALVSILSQAVSQPAIQNLKIGELAPGMELVENICTASGAVIVEKGQLLTDSMCVGLAKLPETGLQILEPITVLQRAVSAKPKQNREEPGEH